MDLTGFGSIADLIKDGIDKVFPDPAERAKAQVAILEAQNAGRFKEMDEAFELAKAQIAANASAGPGLHFRDGAGWVCVVSFALLALKAPIEWGLALAGHPMILPSVDTSTTMPMLFGLLGLGGMHTIEQVKGTK